MGLIEVASNNSVWRGMDYYEAKKVIFWEKTGESEYDGDVAGSEDKVYSVHIDKTHPRKSTCNCAFADGRRVVCKHMIALYFTAEPQAATKFLKDVEIWEAEWAAEQERREQEHIAELKAYVKSLKKVELQEKLLDALLELENRRNYW